MARGQMGEGFEDMLGGRWGGGGPLGYPRRPSTWLQVPVSYARRRIGRGSPRHELLFFHKPLVLTKPLWSLIYYSLALPLASVSFLQNCPVSPTNWAWS
jgi:hypothetical protein